MSRTKKSSKSIASGLLFTAVTLCTSLFATPWLLQWLGSERFGTFRVLVDWYGYIGLLELGLGGALLARLAVAVGGHDISATRSLIACGIRAYLSVMPAMIIASIALVAALPWLMPSRVIGRNELYGAGLILLFGILLAPLSVFRALAEARQRAYVVSVLLTAQSLLMTALLAMGAWAGWGLVGQSLATASAQVFIVLLLTWDGLRTYPGVLSERPRREVTRNIWSLNWPTFILNASGRVGLLTDNIIIALVIGPVAVVPFFLTQRLATIAVGQIQGIGNSTWAGLVELHSQGQVTVFRARLLELTGLVSGLSICLLGPIAAYNAYFIEHWVGHINYAGEAVTIMACVNVWLLAVNGLWGWPVSGTGNVSRWAPYAAAFTVVNLFTSIVGTLLLGTVGPLLGTLTAFMLINSWAMPHVLNQIFHFSPWELWRVALAPFTWGLPYVVILWLLARSHTPLGWLGLLTEMILAGLSGLVLWWTMSLSRLERTIWVARLQGALGK